MCACSATPWPKPPRNANTKPNARDHDSLRAVPFRNLARSAKVTIDDTVQLISENQSVYVPLGAVHRMENPGKVPMVLIEVQTGTYLGEDDIVRYEDVYART